MAEKLSELIKQFVNYELEISLKQVSLQHFKKQEQALRQAVIDEIKVKREEVGQKIDKIKVPESS